ncbi:hypothetical protein K440DRAFT_642111 [Wilcoxina mikolae CBS 423.85]|nr:hypothetical protein K440DRAFT_642111 [Wilcoxina mikolae CBS 423.85]
MNTSVPIVNSTGIFAGSTYCRPATWIDVAKFFAANYFSHAFTINSRPGGLSSDNVCFVLWSLFMPYAGVGRAVRFISIRARGAKDDLAMAHRAGALYTLLKIQRTRNGGGETWQAYPTSVRHTVKDKMYPNSPTDVPPMKRSGNYSVVKAVVAICQALYGSWELYSARGKQLETYGYAAFSLTVVPYVTMDTEYNELGAAGCEELNKLMVGAVATMEIKPYNQRETQSEAKKILTHMLDRVTIYDSDGNRLLRETMFTVAPAVILGVCAFMMPYIVAYKLTGFQAENSSLLQRGWITVWLVFGQVFGLLAIYFNPTIFSMRPLRMAMWVLVLGILLLPPAVVSQRYHAYRTKMMTACDPMAAGTEAIDSSFFNMYQLISPKIYDLRD